MKRLTMSTAAETEVNEDKRTVSGKTELSLLTLIITVSEV